ncbi:DUF7289 family protein [Halogranum rubrum]|uniref:Type IV pilin n=1 Tax=Halogranum salarium B-1 TaxID=1210908 RepID=J2ZJA3_9EURY|nr:hypothetical protein [Halogranum salarium]EJN60795.1 hypothetical protein HSB1_13980 [Halogranum salarium B-1]
MSARLTGRAQSAVVGVALLLGVTMLSLGVLTASIGTVVQSNADAADAGRVATDLDAALDPVSATGPDSGHVSFTDGKLRRVDRSVRLLNDSGVVRNESVGGLVYSNEHHRVAFSSGAVVRGTGENARFTADPPLATSENVLLVGVARLNASGPDTVDGTNQRVRLETNVSHRRQSLGNDSYRVAVETATPAAWERYFARQNATTTRRDFDGDGVTSVVGQYPGDRTTYLVVHDVRLVMRHG